jgi:hypothetical protein
MKAYNRDGKINFVDENNVFLGYDMNERCCEHPGWFIADTQQTEIPKKLDLKTMPELTDYWFDTHFVHMDSVENGVGDFTAMVVFRLKKHNGSEDAKYLHIFNFQNGYYSHGFEVTTPGAFAIKGML